LEPEGDDDRAADDAEGDEAVDASVVAVCDQGRTRKAIASSEANLRRDLVAKEADYTSGGESPKI
jgi:hypothetical protein